MIKVSPSLKFVYILALMMLLVGCTTAPPPTPLTTTPSAQKLVSQPSDGSTPITTRMTLMGLPGLNESVELVFVASTITDAPDTEIEIQLPEDARLVSGDLRWTGDLLTDQPVTVNALVQFTSYGNKELVGRALSKMENGDVWGDASYIYFHITEKGTFEGYEPQESPDSPGTRQDE
jgi:hypothetical protein